MEYLWNRQVSGLNDTVMYYVVSAYESILDARKFASTQLIGKCIDLFIIYTSLRDRSVKTKVVFRLRHSRKGSSKHKLQ